MAIINCTFLRVTLKGASSLRNVDRGTLTGKGSTDLPQHGFDRLSFLSIPVRSAVGMTIAIVIIVAAAAVVV